MTDTLPAVAPPGLTTADVAELTGLKFPRWQTFVVALTSGMSRADAAARAGYIHNRNAGDRLMRKPAIAAAVAAVRAAMAARAVYGLDSLIAELDQAAQFAIQTENATALVRARELKGKCLGLVIDRLDARIQTVPFKIVISGIADRPAIEADATEVRRGAA